MAKTRIKTTPTRMQKEAMASAAVTTITKTTVDNVLEKRLSVLKSNTLSSSSKESTIIAKTQPPRRTNSISSATSTISHTSDGHSSTAESPPPTTSNTPTKSNGPTMAELTENAIKTLNAGLLAKTNALRNRKVYMITEKHDESRDNDTGNSCTTLDGTRNCNHKRKMYLIMEENPVAEASNPEKYLKTDFRNSSKKLTLYTDTTNGQLPQKFEKILPEILNCIQSKGGVAQQNNDECAGSVATSSNGAGNTEVPIVAKESECLKTIPIATPRTTATSLLTEKSERLPLTLPPKKNRTKIIQTEIIPITSTSNDNNAQNFGRTSALETIAGGSETMTRRPFEDFQSGTDIADTTIFPFNQQLVRNGNNKNRFSATPVIVNASTLAAPITTTATAKRENVSKQNGCNPTNSPQTHKNINLSTDFLFLMKMLPKLESIPEPHKSQVKTYIEEIINQNAAQFGSQLADT